MMTLCAGAALPPRHVCITEPPVCTHTHTHMEWNGQNDKLKYSSSACLAHRFLFFFLTIWVIYIESIKHTISVLLSRWLSIPGFLYPYTTLHSLLMANYIKYNGLIMLNRENEDLKYGIIHFMFPIILYCRILKLTISKNTRWYPCFIRYPHKGANRLIHSLNKAP